MPTTNTTNTTMTDREQVESMTDRELVAFWNVLQFDARLGHRDIYKETLVSMTLSEREIPHEIGKRTKVA